MVKERMKLTKDMFEAGDMCQQLKSQLESKKRRKSSTKQNKQHKTFQNRKKPAINIENMPFIEEQNNSVIIWSVSDNIHPKVQIMEYLFQCI